LILNDQKPLPQRKKKGKKRKKANGSAGRGKSARLGHQPEIKIMNTTANKNNWDGGPLA
jgi:hypothetical protein